MKQYKQALSELYKNDINRFEKVVNQMSDIDKLDNLKRSLPFHAVIEGNINCIKNISE